MTSKLIVTGGNPLSGTITPVPNKNSIIKCIPAALLTDEPVTLRRVPRTSDVMYMLQIRDQLGGVHKRIADDEIMLDASKVDSYEIDANLSQKMKASVMFSGPLLARFGRVSMPSPQGCKLGTRPLDTFIDNMRAMGCKDTKHGYTYEIHTDGLRGTRVWQRFPSVTGTENLILMAVCANGTTEIINAACEPHTQDLCQMLVSMGAKIDGIGSNKLIITGVSALSGTDHTIISDHIDVGGLVAAAAITGGDLTITHAITQHMSGILIAFQRLGVQTHIDHDAQTIHVPGTQDLSIHTKENGTIFDLKALQRPLFPPDLVHAAVVLALKSQGQAIFHNLMYEYSFFFVQELAKMKANIILANPVSVITTGPTDFQAADLMCSDIIQAAYGLLLACLAAEGTSTLTAIHPLFRRFPDIVEKFNSLGAQIELVEE